MIDKNATLKQQAKSKTNMLGMAVAILGFVQLNFGNIEQYLGDKSGLVYMAIGIAVIILRQVTTGAVSAK